MAAVQSSHSPSKTESEPVDMAGTHRRVASKPFQAVILIWASWSIELLLAEERLRGRVCLATSKALKRREPPCAEHCGPFYDGAVLAGT
jgi:hypothetical protein